MPIRLLTMVKIVESFSQVITKKLTQSTPSSVADKDGLRWHKLILTKLTMWSHVQDLCRVVFEFGHSVALSLKLRWNWSCCGRCSSLTLFLLTKLGRGPSSHTWLKRFPFKMFIHDLDIFKLFFLSVSVSAIIATIIKDLNVRSYATLIGGLGI